MNIGELLDQLEQLIAGSSSFPQEEDYTLAAQAILRLQETYELETSHLVKGNVSGKQTLTAGKLLIQKKNNNAGCNVPFVITHCRAVGGRLSIYRSASYPLRNLQTRG